MNDKKIIIIVGPSGSGKTSIGERLEKKSIPRLITTTTRPARSKEQEGVDYYFRKLSEMEISDFVEQTKYHNNRYGLTKAEIEAKLEKHDLVHVSLDKSGAKALKEKYPGESFIVFIKITEKEMIERMRNRGDSEKKIKERVHYARETGELSPLKEADLIIRNKKIEESTKKILEHLLSEKKD